MAVPISETTTPFQAQWPKRLDPSLKSLMNKVGRVAWNVFSIVVFPIGLVRLASHYLRRIVFQMMIRDPCRNDLVGYFIRKYIFHGTIPYCLTEDYAEAKGKYQLEEYGGERVSIKAPDDATLDCAFFSGKNPKKVILFVGGNVERWETHGWYNRLGDIDASVFFVNSRGVGKSTGPLYEDGYAMDIYAAAEYLIHEKGIDPEDIAFTGFSMGAANTTRGAGLIQEKYPDKNIKAVNINSFSTLGLEIQEILKNKGFCAAIARLGAQLLQFDMDVKRDFDSLKGKKYVFFNPQDPTILEPAQLATAIQKTSTCGAQLIQFHPFPDHVPFKSFKELILFQHIMRKLLRIQPTRQQKREALCIEKFKQKAIIRIAS